MRFRKLRIGWSLFWDLAFVLLIVLWVRSYWIADNVNWQLIRTYVAFTSFRGSLGTFRYEASADPPGIEHQSWEIGKDSSVDYNGGTGHPLPSYLGFKSSWLSAPIPLDTTTVVIPYWFPTIACAVAALAPWIRRLKWRFSLRTMLIATTLVAAVLALIAWSVR